jgi:3-hydroxyacyl-CoA dehydrogenase
VLDLAPDYVAPLPRTITALGKDAMGNLLYAGWAMREGGQITDHEVRIARELAYVLCGGDGPPRVVTEQDILDLEREAFLRLLGTKETQERMRTRSRPASRSAIRGGTRLTRVDDQTRPDANETS